MEPNNLNPGAHIDNKAVKNGINEVPGKKLKKNGAPEGTEQRREESESDTPPKREDPEEGKGISLSRSQSVTEAEELLNEPGS